MFGLVVLVVGAIYLVVLIAVTLFAYFAAKKRGYSTAKRWLAAAGGFLVVYLPVFWDFIPTHIANQYYCSTQAGFTVYKSVEQWVAENPGVAKGLTKENDAPYNTSSEGTSRIVLNERFVSETRRSHPIRFLSTQIFEDVIVDEKKGEVLARHVSVASGPGGQDWRELKFWLSGRCVPPRMDFVKFETTVRNLGESK